MLALLKGLQSTEKPYIALSLLSKRLRGKAGGLRLLQNKKKFFLSFWAFAEKEMGVPINLQSWEKAYLCMKALLPGQKCF